MSRNSFVLGILVALPAFGSAEELPQLCRATSHPIRYHLAWPENGWQRCPALIALAGADADFAGHARRLLKARGDRCMVLVVPCTFKSANRIAGSTYERFREVYDDDLIRRVGSGLVPDVRQRLSWDEAGLLAIVRDLRERGMEGDVHLTGFSAGGVLAWWMALRHPDMFASVVPVCSNFPFWRIWRSDAVDMPARERLRVHAISGEGDPLRPSRVGLPMPPTAASLVGTVPLAVGAWWARRRGWSRRRVALIVLPGCLIAVMLIIGRWSGNDVQTQCAVELLRELGYGRVEWTTEPGMGHEPAAWRVVEWVGALANRN
jgi:pimeloyl-ACP methyl ester carboxylesterase